MAIFLFTWIPKGGDSISAVLDKCKDFCDEAGDEDREPVPEGLWPSERFLGGFFLAMGPGGSRRRERRRWR